MKNKQNNSNMVIYNDGELELNVSVEKETVWLTQAQRGQSVRMFSGITVRLETA